MVDAQSAALALANPRAMFDVDSDLALAKAVLGYLRIAHVEHPQQGYPLHPARAQRSALNAQH